MFVGYFGLSMASAKFGTNAFVSSVSSALMEIPAYALSMLLLDHWGRKPLCSFAFLLSGIICIPAGFTSGNLQMVLTLIGKFLGNKINTIYCEQNVIV